MVGTLEQIGEDRAYGVRQNLRQLARMRERQWDLQEHRRCMRHARVGILVRPRSPTGKWWWRRDLLMPSIDETRRKMAQLYDRVTVLWRQR